MFEIDKERFGEFLCVQRKKNGLTQKELAQRLFVSDKAVSKWERGISMPDISLLIPLSEILGVTVTELLEGHEIERQSEMDTDHVESLVKKALSLSEEQPQETNSQRMNHRLFWLLGIGVAVAEVRLLLAAGFTITQMSDGNLFLYEFLSIFFGFFFCFVVREKLPNYYDQNKISAYYYGAFRMNLPGVHFNNSNWPHIVKTGRIWSGTAAMVMPVLYFLMCHFLGNMYDPVGGYALLAIFLCGLFIPLYIVGKKYE